ncbi:trans-sulfuration enzyme family protein [Nakamurella aerolata]|uniref:homocysteine desulfhydrase n=1 Tax=Nakamurella aerolata TaxID=1656892 RepID=A0A849AII3_9ACTN|nr:PLP-dependent transferase [Nakamurella aerolata]NNG36622.1 aminotransferase class V-fold PLP-dependent enzyme [Nakamurella aerolata]
MTDPAAGQQPTTTQTPRALGTRTVHPPRPAAAAGRPLSQPIYQASVFAHDDPTTLTDSLDNPRGAYGYSRMANPTVRALEAAAADLEGAELAVATASGMGAIHAVLGSLLSAGGHVVIQESIYGGTTGLFDDMAARWNIEFTAVPGDDPAAVRAALRADTAAVYLETISNPMTAIADIAGIAEVTRGSAAKLVVDNTFASPMGCRPLQLGADVVIHSATKYLGGHDDVTAGIACYADAELGSAAWKFAVATGSTLDPFAAWLVLRGMATLALRMRAAGATAAELADRLRQRDDVLAVHHPSLAGHPQHRLATEQLNGFGPMLAFDLADADAAQQLIGRLQLIQNAPSMGGVETVAMHPASTSHRHYSPRALAAAGIAPGTVRISTGIEEVEDIWTDLRAALG